MPTADKENDRAISAADKVMSAATDWATKRAEAIKRAQRIRAEKAGEVDFLKALDAAEARDAALAGGFVPPEKMAKPKPRRKRRVNSDPVRAAEQVDRLARPKPKKRAASVCVPGKTDAGTEEEPRKSKAGSRDAGREILSFGYEPLGPIAAGAFSTILRARHVESGTEYAVKTFDLAKCMGALADDRDRELDVLRLLQPAAHAHIANMVAEHTTAHGTHAVLHYCGGGSLLWHLQKLTKRNCVMGEVEAVLITAQMGSALNFMHGLGVAHRDVKPGNVLRDHDRVWRLCDFGFAIKCGERRLKKMVGTPAYIAPELVTRSAYTGPSVDMWAFGCMVYELMHGRPCFVAPTMDDLDLRIKNGFNAPWAQRVPKACRQLILGLVVKDPARRLSAAQVLESEWVKEWCTPSCEAEDDGEGEEEVVEVH